MTTNGTVTTPQTWTIRFKNGRSTILLFVEPLQSLSQVRTELLAAVNDVADRDGTFNGFAIPQNPDDIMLGRMIDETQPELGFADINGDTPIIPDINVKGKGRASLESAMSAVLDSAKGAGLKDNSIVAFKFRSEHAALMRDGTGATKAGILNDLDELDDDTTPERWNVDIPTMESTYGEDDEQLG